MIDRNWISGLKVYFSHISVANNLDLIEEKQGHIPIQSITVNLIPLENPG